MDRYRSELDIRLFSRALRFHALVSLAESQTLILKAAKGLEKERVCFFLRPENREWNLHYKRMV
jgi:hypothetical protein